VYYHANIYIYIYIYIPTKDLTKSGELMHMQPQNLSPCQ
jgi:hypothetical protein